MEKPALSIAEQSQPWNCFQSRHRELGLTQKHRQTRAECVINETRLFTILTWPLYKQKRQDAFCFCGAVLFSQPVGVTVAVAISKASTREQNVLHLTFHSMISEVDVQASCEQSACHEQGRLLIDLRTAKWYPSQQSHWIWLWSFEILLFIRNKISLVKRCVKKSLATCLTEWKLLHFFPYF